jgi:hypothetical protein
MFASAFQASGWKEYPFAAKRPAWIEDIWKIPAHPVELVTSGRQFDSRQAMPIAHWTTVGPKRLQCFSMRATISAGHWVTVGRGGAVIVGGAGRTVVGGSGGTVVVVVVVVVVVLEVLVVVRGGGSGCGGVPQAVTVRPTMTPARVTMRTRRMEDLQLGD